MTETVNPSGTEIMDIDACLQQAGEFGPAQKRIYYVVNLMNVLAAMQTLAPAFIAFEPEWTCGSQSTPEEQQTALQRCTLFEQGRCHPHYLTGYTTIVTEVIHKGACTLSSIS